MHKLSGALSLFLLLATAAHASIVAPAALTDVTAGAAQIVRGECVSAVPGVVEIARARIAVTVYTFRVAERLKGAGGELLVFRQVGRPDRGEGPRRQPDLGRAAGLPVYAPGSEYLVFLLPESRAGLTSPAGAVHGAYRIEGDTVFPLGPVAEAAPGRPVASGDPWQTLAGGAPVAYERFRAAILKEVGR